MTKEIEIDLTKEEWDKVFKAIYKKHWKKYNVNK